MSKDTSMSKWLLSASDFTPVTRYLCKWCGKFFATDKRHDCKFNPRKENCFSCKHCTGYDECGDTGECGEKIAFFNCELGTKTDGFNVVSDTHENNYWHGLCPHYELRPNYKGSKSWSTIRFIQRERERIAREEDSCIKTMGIEPFASNIPWSEQIKRDKEQLEKIIKEFNG